MEPRDELIGRIKPKKRDVWAEGLDDTESNELRDKARAFLSKQGTLSDYELKKMVSLLFTQRAGGF